MTVLGPRGRVLVIPSETIERVAQQLLAHGRIARGYLGLGLQPVRIDRTMADAAGLAEPKGLIVISVDPNGPGQRAGIKQGDILIRWDADPLHSVRGVYTLLGPESVGQSVALGMLRAGKQISLTVEIEERVKPQE
jgi:S1-C subfamily serine protease